MTRRGESVEVLGEFGLIDRLAARVPAKRADVVLGIGDDVAAIELARDRLLLVTCDVQVGGVHFLPQRCDPYRLGRKAAAINISDIAAAGGRPTHFVSSLVLPGETEVAFVERLYDGLADEAKRCGADLVGGNVSRGDSLVVDLTLLGVTTRENLLRRSGARVGDRVIVTGRLGAAAAGLELTRRPDLVVDAAARESAFDAFETPRPRLAESRALVEAGGVHAAIDISDGLAADLGHLCDASRVGVAIDPQAIPVAAAAREVARAAGRRVLDWALGGGEDYELILTAGADRAAELVAIVSAATGTLATISTERSSPASAGGR